MDENKPPDILEKAIYNMNFYNIEHIEKHTAKLFAENVPTLIRWVFDRDNKKRGYEASIVLESRDKHIRNALCAPEIIAYLNELWRTEEHCYFFTGKMRELLLGIIPYIEDLDSCSFVLDFIDECDNYTYPYFFDRMFVNEDHLHPFHEWLAKSNFSDRVYNQLATLANNETTDSHMDPIVNRGDTLIKIMIHAAKVPILAELFSSQRYVALYKSGFKASLLNDRCWELINALAQNDPKDLEGLVETAVDQLQIRQMYFQSQYYALMFITKMVSQPNDVVKILIAKDAVKMVLDIFSTFPGNTFASHSVSAFITSTLRKGPIVEQVTEHIVPYMIKTIREEGNMSQIATCYHTLNLMSLIQRSSPALKNSLKKSTEFGDFVSNELAARNKLQRGSYGGEIDRTPPPPKSRSIEILAEPTQAN